MNNIDDGVSLMVTLCFGELMFTMNTKTGSNVTLFDMDGNEYLMDVRDIQVLSEQLTAFNAGVD